MFNKTSLLTKLTQKTGHYGFLLLSLLLMIALKPFLNNVAETALIADIFSIAILLASVYAVRDNKTWLHFICILIAIIIASLRTVYYLLGKTPQLYILEMVLTIIFILQIHYMMVQHLVSEHEVTSDTVMGGACVFVLIGVVWAFAYYLLETLRPHSFYSNTPLGDNINDFLYYSFITLTSLGYGDIFATSQEARGLTILEGIIGQLYLAIMVSRLVSLHISDSQNK